MYHPTTRVLTVLELLQSRPQLTGQELAERLEVSPRTVRRYVAMLQDLGIPVEADRGRHGAYRLAPGFKLPPLMFNDDEALALVLGLRLTRRLGLPVDVSAVEGALAKAERAMPLALRERVQAVQDALVVYAASPYAPPATNVVVALSAAVRQGQRVRLRHRSVERMDSLREVDPYGVVYYGGRWFLTGFCHLRQGLRTFRLDRVSEVVLCPEAFTRPADFDALAHVVQSLATTPGTWAVEVVLRLTLDEARERVPPEMAILHAVHEGVCVRLNVQSLDWFATVLVSLECDFIIRQPPELRETVRRLGEKLIQASTLTEAP
jgi:predicted DNA-binding transcriptional regulator YafY